jgi:membrane protease subunit HflC
MTENKSMLAKNWPIVAPIGILVLVLIGFMFLFIVQENDHVIITRFGDPQLERNTSPGLTLKWPYPVEEIWRHDKRVHVYPSTDRHAPTKGEFEEVYTSDKSNIIVSIALTWSVWADESQTDMKQNIVKYMNNVGTVREAEIKLNDLVRSAKTAVFGRHAYSELINSEGSEIDTIERELFTHVQEQAQELYAIDVQTLSISHLGLPEKTTALVFQRMIAERKREADRIKAEGKREADRIRAEGKRIADQIISEGRKKAKKARSEGDVAAAASYQTFQKAPELAIFLRQLKALPLLAGKRTFLYLDFTTPPLNLMSPKMLRNLQNNKLEVGTVNSRKEKSDK